MISIIMPVYNTEMYLETAIWSVLMQTNGDFELICIDDCSTDSSLDILKKFSTLDSRIKLLINDTNRGLSYNRNRGIEIAKGEYIFFLDSDDWISLDALEKLQSVVETKNVDMIMFKFITYWEDLNNFSIEPFYDMEFMDKFIDKEFNHHDLDPNSLFDIPGASCNKLYSKDFLVKINFKFREGVIFEDVPVFFENMIKANKIYLMDEYLYNRRRRKNSITTLTGKKLLDTIVIAKDLINVFIHDNEIYNRYKKGALNITFSLIKGKYNSIDEKFKEEYFQKSKLLIQELVNNYNIKSDIEENLNKNNLDFYNTILYKNKYECDLENFRITFGEEIVFSDMKITDKFEKQFLDNKLIYENNKNEFLNFIFRKFKEKCLHCGDDEKEGNFQQCKFLINKMYSEYGLYDDIMNCVDSKLIDFFNQDFI